MLETVGLKTDLRVNFCLIREGGTARVFAMLRLSVCYDTYVALLPALSVPDMLHIYTM